MAGELTDLGVQSPLIHALAAGQPLRVGSFRFLFEGERWEWSPQVERMHGYEPGEVELSTEVVLSHKHPDDVGKVAHTLEVMRRTRAAFSTRHRIVDTQGQVRHVVVIGDQLFDETGDVVGTQGFYVDVTPAVSDAHQQVVTEAVAEIAESRGAIEQAKGMLMLIYRIDSDAAFDLLRWRSQETNTKLRLLAEQVIADFAGVDYSENLPERVVFDRLLLSAHRRVESGG
ncbi:PAS and ANTAR domain-containing protein [Mycolicibacterium brumae]|uniref:histidine kinase n=1 Tax=Mycolicibacterium brumae TaxID=85968 RepID=A0A2G5PCF4_9MYCO|nr:PAS and ANTAR domain-containing protein [Mycolicibacterium brumae]MCV7191423.1 PAS and ANTAR domain-containing protein [Mycolicibacterium brumae]PIB75760.1 antitermination regulator [Mycolicibacterium brumae]RWA16135.1 hypothetical protein MBRU_08480 [Mycolicibacterium brumae DSM 44177]UWW09469.1 PAS and ANTAR domain-containing protein [Mycolicibacterium brumae]